MGVGKHLVDFRGGSGKGCFHVGTVLQVRQGVCEVMEHFGENGRAGSGCVRLFKLSSKQVKRHFRAVVG